MTLKARITAIDRFIKGCREDGIYDDLNACCVMAGWDSLAGALTPLKGAAPTNNGLSVYDRGVGIAGDGSSAYLDSNRANNADGQNDQHMSVFAADVNTYDTDRPYVGVGFVVAGSTYIATRAADAFVRNRSSTANTGLTQGPAGSLIAIDRSDASSFSYRQGGTSTGYLRDSQSPASGNIFVFSSNGFSAFSDATLSFYSIGSATDLAALDARVSTLMADLRAIEEAGFDRDAIAYIRAVEEADGAYLETSVKVAINNLVAGLKADGLWESMASSCLLCGPRTLAGALVPLRGDAPTAYAFTSGDYSRTEGLTGAGAGTYLYLSGVHPDGPVQNSAHQALYITSQTASASYKTHIREFDGPEAGDGSTQISQSATSAYIRCRSLGDAAVSESPQTGLTAINRSNSSSFEFRRGGASSTLNVASTGITDNNAFIYRFSSVYSDITLAFYSLGTSLDLAKLDTHISDYVTAIGAAI